MKKITLLFALIIIVFACFSQDSLRLELIAQDLEQEKFQGKHTFFVDTLIEVRNFKIYGVTPFASGFSFCYIFDSDDSMIKYSGFPQGMNRIYYKFEIYETESKDFIVTYWLGGGTISTSLYLSVYSISESVRVAYGDLVYNRNKFDNEELFDLNSFQFEVEDDKLIIVKKVSSPITAKLLIPEMFELHESEIKEEEIEIIILN